MTEVIYQPREQVIIHEYSRYESIEALIRGSFGGVPPGSNVGPIKWVDGIALVQNAYPMTDTVVKELLKGKLHWDHVSFAPMEHFRNNIHLEDVRITVSIINVSTNPIFRIIARFIRENLMRDEPQV